MSTKLYKKYLNVDPTSVNGVITVDLSEPTYTINYDGNKYITSIVFADNRRINYFYNAHNLLITQDFRDVDNNLVYRNSYTYDSNGLLTNKTYTIS